MMELRRNFAVKTVPLDAQVIKQRDDVARHVDQRVGHRAGPAEGVADEPPSHRALGPLAVHLG